MTGLLAVPGRASMATLAAGLGCAAAGGALAGLRAAVGALVATAVVLVFLAAGLLPLVVTRGQEDRAGLGLVVLLVNYTLRLALAVLLLAAAARLVDPVALGVTVVLTALTWTGTHVALLTRRPRRG